MLVQIQYIYLVVEPTERYVSLGNVIVGVMFGLWMVTRLARSAQPYPGTRIDALIVLFLFWMALSLLWTNNFKEGLLNLAEAFLIIGASILVIVSIVNSDSRLQTVFRILIVTGAISAVTCLISVQLFPDYTYYAAKFIKPLRLEILFNSLATGRRGHALSHPLSTSYWLNFSILAGVLQLITTRKHRVALCFLILLMLTGHLSTLSKGPLIALGCGGLFFLWMIRPTRKFMFCFIGIGLVVLMLCYMAANATFLIKSIKFTASQISSTEENSSLGSRLLWWGICLKQGFEAYGFGTGAGGLGDYLGLTPHAHSIWMALYGELGFCGLTLYLLIVFSVVREAFITMKDRACEYFKRVLVVYIAGLIMLYVYLSFNYEYLMYHSWWYLGLGLAIINLAGRTPMDYKQDCLPFRGTGPSLCVC